MSVATVGGLDLLRTTARNMSRDECLAFRDIPNYHCAGDEFQWMLPKLEEFARSINFPITYEAPSTSNPDLDTETMGLCRRKRILLDEGNIFINPKFSPNETFRVGVHELTHALGAFTWDYGTDEITAESTAYMVCRELGCDTWNFSCPYVAINMHCYQGDFLTDEIEKYTHILKDGLL